MRYVQETPLHESNRERRIKLGTFSRREYRAVRQLTKSHDRKGA